MGALQFPSFLPFSWLLAHFLIPGEWAAALCGPCGTRGESSFISLSAGEYSLMWKLLWARGDLCLLLMKRWGGPRTRSKGGRALLNRRLCAWRFLQKSLLSGEVSFSLLFSRREVEGFLLSIIKEPLYFCTLNVIIDVYGFCGPYRIITGELAYPIQLATAHNSPAVVQAIVWL